MQFVFHFRFIMVLESSNIKSYNMKSQLNYIFEEIKELLPFKQQRQMRRLTILELISITGKKITHAIAFFESIPKTTRKSPLPTPIYLCHPPRPPFLPQTWKHQDQKNKRQEKIVKIISLGVLCLRPSQTAHKTQCKHI